MTKEAKLGIRVADYNDSADQAAISHLMQIYARDPMGGGASLDPDKADELAAKLREFGRAMTVLARWGDEDIGLINCIEGFSTFQGSALLNVHDVVVHPEHRSRGVARAMFAEVERVAIDRDYCKLTLEVLEGNEKAKALYTRLGFEPYMLSIEFGVALFYEKKIVKRGS